MPNTLPLQEWLGYLDQEYLSSFILSGGGSIKFVVPVEEEFRSDLKLAVRNVATKSAYICVDIDSADTRIHMPQDLFFEIAKQVDWRLVARRFLCKVAEELNYSVQGIFPESPSNIFESIAEVNSLDKAFLIQGLRPQIQSQVYQNTQLAKDFRVAMSHLCLLEATDGGDDQYEGQPLIDWLTGSNTRVSSVRPFSIYNSINRTTARYFIESAVHWLKFVGYAGTVILLDNSRVMLARNPRDGLRYYSKAMAIDHYELLREFIDGTDRLTATLMIVVPTSDFLDTDHTRRGYGIYQALMTRVMDDVRDRSLVNPIASLVSIK